jgi:hypothetical protein
MMALNTARVQVPRAVSSHVDGVRVRSRRAVHVLVRVDCRRRSTVIKSTILPSTSLHVGARLPKVRFDAGGHSRVEEMEV